MFFWNESKYSMLILDNSSFRAFDVDLLYLAHHFEMSISEVAVNWTEIDGIFFTILFYYQ